MFNADLWWWWWPWCYIIAHAIFFALIFFSALHFMRNSCIYTYIYINILSYHIYHIYINIIVMIMISRFTHNLVCHHHKKTTSYTLPTAAATTSHSSVCDFPSSLFSFFTATIHYAKHSYIMHIILLCQFFDLSQCYRNKTWRARSYSSTATTTAAGINTHIKPTTESFFLFWKSQVKLTAMQGLYHKSNQHHANKPSSPIHVFSANGKSSSTTTTRTAYIMYLYHSRRMTTRSSSLQQRHI